MRTISTDAGAVLTGGARKSQVRLSVKDSGGNYRDLTTYALGENLLKSIHWSDDTDAPTITWEATLVREMESLSIVPLMQGSGFNKQFDISVAYAALLQPGRDMKVEWAIQAEDDPAAPTWVLGFTGKLDVVGWGGDSEVTLAGRGAEAQLMDCYIEKERIYAFATGANADRGCTIFIPLQTYAVGDRVIPTDANDNEHFYRITSITTGIAAATEPVWPTGGASTVVSDGVTFTESGATTLTTGTAVETIMQQLLDDNLGVGVVTLSTPVSPAWLVKLFTVSRQPLLDELKLLADQIGWCCRYKFDTGSGTMLLTLYDPARASTTSLRTFSASEVMEIGRAQMEIFDIRNAVQVVYSDTQDLDAGRNAKRNTILVTDATSITKYGRRFCEIAESSSSNIDTSTEATVLANAVLSDLKEPTADFEAVVPLFPYVELPDLYTLSANGVHFDVDEKLAVVGYDHRHSADESVTSFRIRGTPGSGSERWLMRTTEVNHDGSRPITSRANTMPITLKADTKPVGGCRVSFEWREQPPLRKSPYPP